MRFLLNVGARASVMFFFYVFAFRGHYNANKRQWARLGLVFCSKYYPNGFRY